MDFEKRIYSVQKNILSKKSNALLILDVENIFYLTGFIGSFAALVTLRDKVYLLVDGRYYEKAKRSCEHCNIVLFENLFSEINKILTSEKIVALYFDEEDVKVSFLSRMKKELKDGVNIIPTKDSYIRKLRMVKDDCELEIIRKAVKKSKKIMKKFIANSLTTGVSEKALAAQLEYMMKTDADGISFDAIVASGKNSSLPHATPTEKKLSSRDVVLIDYGLKWKGYCTDHTKTLFLGANSLEKYYNIVHKAIKIGLSFVKPDNPIKLVDENIRKFFEKEGVLKHFLHSSGHGVGINVHEAPSLSYKTEGVFKEGMVLTIEPGLYFEKIGGIRLEEMFVVTKTGYEIL